MISWEDKLVACCDYIKSHIKVYPKLGIVLGTGLNNLVSKLDSIQYELDYSDLPYFPVSTVESHKGKLIFATIGQKPVIIMAGRFHYYEGYGMKALTFPIRVLKALGVESIIMSNVSGSVNPKFKAGDLVVIKDHINMMPENPLRGENIDAWGPRFPDMSEAYDKEWIRQAQSQAKALKLNLPEAIYYALPGPNLETRAEYEMIHRMGADVIGMSTVPEVIVAKHCGLKVLVISMVSNLCYPPESIKETTLEGVLEVARQAAPDFAELVLSLVIGDW